MASENCPTKELLRQYSLGLLTGEESDSLAKHLEDCEECQATIVSLGKDEDTLIGSLKEPLDDHPYWEEPQFLSVLEKAIELPGERRDALDSASSGNPESVVVPRMLGDYQILEILGHGGMGRVYKALHMKLDRIVAIKILPRGRLADPRAASRFEREMKAVGRLKHANIVQAYDAREIDDTLVLIMEFIDGLDLAELIRRTGPLTIAEACALTRETALALQCAHEHGLVHRDIKPSNIMLSLSGEVKLLDLGLARFYEEAPAGEEMTGAGQVMGTADYIAPEQAVDSRTVDIRADLYSLGCTLYKLLSGRAPFSGQPYRGTLDKMNAHVSHVPPPITQVAPAVNEELAGILSKMMAKNPSDRFAAPADVAAALEPFCAGADLVKLASKAAKIDEPQRCKEGFGEPFLGKTVAAGRPSSVSPVSRRLWKIFLLFSTVAAFAGAIAFSYYLGSRNSLKPEQEQPATDAPWDAKVPTESKLADGFRRWTDSSGKHHLQAKYDSLKDGNVVLIRKNGEITSVEPEKLSQADREYIARENGGNPFEESKFQTPEETEKEANPPADGSPRMVKVDWSHSQAVSIIPPGSAWQVKVSEVVADDTAAKSVFLPAKTEIFERMAGMAISHNAKWAVVGYELIRPEAWTKFAMKRATGELSGDLEATARLALCDIQSGRLVSSFSTQAAMAPLALHDDGKQILMRRNLFGFGRNDQMELWSIDGKNTVRSLHWTPYDDAVDMNRDVVWAAFLDSHRVATCSSGGKLVLWNLSPLQPICYFSLSEGAVPALSPDRKRIAFVTTDMVGLLDVDKPEVIAEKNTPFPVFRPSVAFSPSGRRFACLTQNQLLVWDTATGKLEKNFSVAGLTGLGEIVFPGEDFVLLNNFLLVELENQVKLWNYYGGECAVTASGMTFFVLAKDIGEGTLLAAKIPHPEASDLLNKALTQPDFFAFHKGMPVKLDVSGIPDADQQIKVKAILTKKLNDLNCNIDSDGKAEVTAYVEGPVAKEISIAQSGKYDVQEYLTKLKLTVQGKVLWEVQGSNIPDSLNFNPPGNTTGEKKPWIGPFSPTVPSGKNTESVLRELSRQPSYKFYEGVVLPEYLQLSEEKRPALPNGLCPAIGQTILTLQGIR